MTIDKALIVLVACFIAFILLDHLIGGRKKNAKEGSATRTQGSEEKNETPIGGAMVEYSRASSQELGFNLRNGFKRPSELRRKGLNRADEIQLDKLKLKEEKFFAAMKNYITLKEFNSKDNLKNKTVRVFIDTINDTSVLVRDNSAFLELQLGQVFNMAGEFVLINLNKEGDRIRVNYVLTDG
jgi:hypothetical protein